MGEGRVSRSFPAVRVEELREESTHPSASHGEVLLREEAHQPHIGIKAHELRPRRGRASLPLARISPQKIIGTRPCPCDDSRLGPRSENRAQLLSGSRRGRHPRPCTASPPVSRKGDRAAPIGRLDSYHASVWFTTRSPSSSQKASMPRRAPRRASRSRPHGQTCEPAPGPPRSACCIEPACAHETAAPADASAAHDAPPH